MPGGVGATSRRLCFFAVVLVRTFQLRACQFIAITNLNGTIYSMGRTRQQQITFLIWLGFVFIIPTNLCISISVLFYDAFLAL